MIGSMDARALFGRPLESASRTRLQWGVFQSVAAMVHTASSARSAALVAHLIHTRYPVAWWRRTPDSERRPCGFGPLRSSKEMILLHPLSVDRKIRRAAILLAWPL